MNIYVAGSISWDTLVYIEKISSYYGDKFVKELVVCDGGAGGNVAYFLKKVFNINPIFYSCVGGDEDGIRLIEKFKANDLDVDKIKILIDQKSTQHIIIIDKSEVSDIYVFSGAMRYFSMKLHDTSNLEKADYFYLATVRQETAAEILDVLNNSPVNIFYNPGKALYPDKEILLKRVDRIDCLFLNQEEILTYSNEKDIFTAAKYFIDKGIKILTVTLGKFGALTFDNDNCYYAPGFKTLVKGTIGCGDIYAAGFIGSLIKGDTVKKATSFGNILGAIASSFKTIRDFEIDKNNISNLRDNKAERNIFDIRSNDLFKVHICE